MSGLDIEAIRERSLLAERLPSGLREHAGRNVTALSDSAADVPALLAQIERLRAELLEEQTVHAKTFDNFESHAAACLEERTRQLDRYARLDAQCDRLRTELRELKEIAGATAEARDEARADYRKEAFEVVRLRGDLARTRAALGNVREHLDLRDGELASANAQRDQARAALSDALQVIADLRGETP